MDIYGSGVVSNTGGYLGRDPGSDGAVTAAQDRSGTTLEACMLVFSGNGTLTINAGGTVSNGIWLLLVMGAAPLVW